MIEKYEKIASVLQDIWLNINWSNMPESRRRGAHQELEAKAKALSRCYSSLPSFLNKLCKSFDSHLSSHETKQIIEENNDEIYLNILRTESQIPFLILKLRQDDRKNKTK